MPASGDFPIQPVTSPEWTNDSILLTADTIRALVMKERIEAGATVSELGIIKSLVFNDTINHWVPVWQQDGTSRQNIRAFCHKLYRRILAGEDVTGMMPIVVTTVPKPEPTVQVVDGVRIIE